MTPANRSTPDSARTHDLGQVNHTFQSVITRPRRPDALDQTFQERAGRPSPRSRPHPGHPMIFSLLLCLLAGVVGRAQAEGFDARFEEIKSSASPADLYRFLYAMPKAGDLHHHAGGSWRMEDLYTVATNKLLNGGNRFYTRVRAGTCPEDDGKWRRFTTLAEFTYKGLSAR